MGNYNPCFSYSCSAGCCNSFYQCPFISSNPFTNVCYYYYVDYYYYSWWIYFLIAAGAIVGIIILFSIIGCCVAACRRRRNLYSGSGVVVDVGNPSINTDAAYDYSNTGNGYGYNNNNINWNADSPNNGNVYMGQPVGPNYEMGRTY